MTRPSIEDVAMGCCETRCLPDPEYLRADLLPEPGPTLYEQFVAENGPVRNECDRAMVHKTLDWIANRGVEVKP